MYIPVKPVKSKVKYEVVDIPEVKSSYYVYPSKYRQYYYAYPSYPYYYYYV